MRGETIAISGPSTHESATSVMSRHLGSHILFSTAKFHASGIFRLCQIVIFCYDDGTCYLLWGICNKTNGQREKLSKCLTSSIYTLRLLVDHFAPSTIDLQAPEDQAESGVFIGPNTRHEAKAFLQCTLACGSLLGAESGLQSDGVAGFGRSEYRERR